MNMRSNWRLIRRAGFAGIACLSISFAAALAHSLVTGYVPWGVDEYQLFGLTKIELKKKFGEKLTFDFPCNQAWMNSDHFGPQFFFTYTDGKVSSVSRMFIDGGGCHIQGPLLRSKVDALKFSIDGLAKLNDNDPKTKKQLEAARAELRAIEKK